MSAHDLAGLGIDMDEGIVLVSDQSGRAQVPGVGLDLLGHLRDDGALLGGQNALERELRLGEVH